MSTMFYTGLTYAGKAGAFPSGALFEPNSLRQAPSFYQKFQAKLERLAVNKHSSLSPVMKKCIITLLSGANVIKHSCLSLTKSQNKLKCLSLADLSNQSMSTYGAPERCFIGIGCDYSNIILDLK
jgi:hypothetical protein